MTSYSRGHATTARVVVAVVIASVTAAISVSADVPAQDQDAAPPEIAGEWFYRHAGGSIYTWTFTDSGEFEWTVTHAGVSTIPTVLGQGNYEATGDDQLILVFVGKDGAAEAPQTRTWRRCGDTLTLWRGESERSYTRTRDGTFEHCEE